jgi:hypothetical protein
MASRSTRSRRVRRRRGLLREGFGGDGTSDRLGPQGSRKKACERAKGGASDITAPQVSGDERSGREGKRSPSGSDRSVACARKHLRGCGPRVGVLG